MNIKQSPRVSDVVVCGGGIAGIAAALASARAGAKTILCEKEYALGGLATLGLIVGYLPLCDGNGVQMSYGICDELARMSAALPGTEYYSAAWLDANGSQEQRKKQRYEIRYNAAGFMIAAERLLCGAGVEILYDVRLSDASVKNGKLRAVTVETKRGKTDIEAAAFVDATGDADLCYFAGEETVECESNSRTGWYYSNGREGVKLHVHSDPYGPNAPAGLMKFGGTRPEDISAHMIAMRAFIDEDVRKNREGDDSFYPLIIPAFHGLRTTRRLAGAFEFSEDKHEGVYFRDAVGMIGNWKKRGPRYTIPLRCMCGAASSNLYAAGRCVCADDSGWDLTRVIPTCAVTGEAAGQAAALTASLGASPSYRMLASALTSRGVVLNRELFDNFM
ncbi:MAG: FAD-dependent oxidoreductase [Eubacteriales bacterium]